MTTLIIPKELAKRGELVLVPRKEYEAAQYILKIIPTEQLWFWTKEWQKKEKKADEDIRAGKIAGPFTSGKALLKSLKSRRKF
ncbi:MAG: hypothetical protein Q7S86_01965 [bacterium]|nr:hypothetical protein [bacterium]